MKKKKNNVRVPSGGEGTSLYHCHILVDVVGMLAGPIRLENIYPPYWSHDRYLVKREQLICKLLPITVPRKQHKQYNHDHFLLIMTSQYGSRDIDCDICYDTMF